MTEQIDVAIIGGGTAGMTAYREAVNHTGSVRLIESGPFGTTCARVGCMPSKLLIAAADAAHHGASAGHFGVEFAPPVIEGSRVMQRVRAERDRFAGFVVEAVESWPKEHVLRAHARFVGTHTLELDDGKTLDARAIVIATGSRPFVPPVFEPLGDLLLTTDEVFELEDLPASLAVIGAGPIGLELGQAFARLGVEITLLSMGGAIATLQEKDLSDIAHACFSEEMNFHPDAKIRSTRVTGGNAEFSATIDGTERTLTVDRVLVAAGRRPNLDDLGLEHTGLHLSERGVPLRDPLTGRCGDSAIFIAGDSGPEAPLLHEAAADGRAAGYNAAHFPDVRAFLRTPPMGIVFSDPQIMFVGKRRAELERAGARFETGSVDWSDQGRARAMAVNRGKLHLYGEHGTGEFLGAEMIGPRAEHLAHLLAWCLQSRLTIPEMIERPFYHPVFEEGLRTALRMLAYHLNLAAKPPPRCLDCGPGG